MRTDIARHARYFSTDAAEPGRAFAYWVNTVCSELIELDIQTRNTTGFQAWMLQKALGPVGLNFIYTREPQRVWRSREAIHRSRESRFDLLHVRSGVFTFDHYGRSFVVRPGECVLIDSSEPYSFESTQLGLGMSLQIPQKWLRNWVAAPEDGVAAVITGDTPWQCALLATLNAVTPEAIDQLVIPGEALSEQIASLLTLAIGSPAAAGAAGRRKRLPAIRQALLEQAHEETLTPAKVAREHGISKRCLHVLFAEAGTTFGQELMSIRLDRARRQLRDPRFLKISVSEIAWRCGFTDSSHFARRFRQRFGTSPRAYRRSALPGLVAVEAPDEPEELTAH